MAQESAITPEEALRWWVSRPAFIAQLNLGIEKVRQDGVVLRMPFNPDFCADSESTLLHGGMLTALLDSAFGMSNFISIEGLTSIATIDLRVDYLRPPRSRADVLVEAECYRQTRHVAFNSGRVWFDGNPDAEIARGTATFALNRGAPGVFDAIRRGSAP